MPQVDRGTRTETSPNHHRCNGGLNVRDFLQFVSSLLLPLMLGVFTIIITIEQQRIATEQRIQDLNSSAQQRAEDRQMAIDQRVQDKLIAKEQRDQDEQRRLQDLKIAEEKRNQDNDLAEKERDMLEKQRTYELGIEATRYEKEHKKYLDALLITYINDIGTLFLNNNGSLTSNPAVKILVRSKTLTLARQLDPSRNIQVLQFLYDAGQLFNGQNPLDLSGVNFDGINLTSMTKYLPMYRLSLCGAHLNNALFDKLDLTNANFSDAHLKDAVFVDTSLEQVDFSRAILVGAYFKSSHIVHTIFDDTNMMNVKLKYVGFSECQFTRTRMKQINIQNTTTFSYCNFTNIHDLDGTNFNQFISTNSNLMNVNLSNTIFADTEIDGTHFIKTELDGSDFSRSHCHRCHFEQSNFNNITFVYADLSQTIWISNVLKNIDFTGANLEAANFLHVSNVEKSSFVETKASEMILSLSNIEFSNFSHCQCNKAEFISVRMSYVSFDNAKLNYANFSNSIVDKDVSCYRIDGFGIDFSRADVALCNFAQSRLTNAIFAWTKTFDSNFFGADVNGIDFSHAILQFAQTTQEQIDLAMSTSNAFYQNRYHRNPNLLLNSGFQCNTTMMINRTFWQVKPSETTIMMIPDNANTCFFTVTQPVVMSQAIDVSRYRYLIDRGRAAIFLAINVWNISTILHITTWTSLQLPYNYSFQVPKRTGYQLLQPTFTIPQGTIHLSLSVVFETATSRSGCIDLSLQDVDTETL